MWPTWHPPKNHLKFNNPHLMVLLPTKAMLRTRLNDTTELLFKHQMQTKVTLTLFMFLITIFCSSYNFMGLILLKLSYWSMFRISLTFIPHFFAEPQCIRVSRRWREMDSIAPQAHQTKNRRNTSYASQISNAFTLLQQHNNVQEPESMLSPTYYTSRASTTYINS